MRKVLEPGLLWALGHTADTCLSERSLWLSMNGTGAAPSPTLLMAPECPGLETAWLGIHSLPGLLAQVHRIQPWDRTCLHLPISECSR